VIATLVFDIETIPDVEGLRRLYELSADESAQSVAEIAFHRRRQQTGSDFLPLHQHRVVAISVALRMTESSREHFRVWSLGSCEDDEKSLIQRFFDGIEKYTPQLVSWNGGGFDLPVLHYRSLIHGVAAPRYWDMGDGDYKDSRDFRWNNYISRYHSRHLDLMDVLALYQPRANAPLDEIAQLCGLPGKLGMDGSQVWEAFCAGSIEKIRNYCETDVANTYLVFLRFQLMRGCLTPEAYAGEVQLVRDSLGKAEGAHWQEFLSRWQ
jgi:predicted PolB exonuclease-like 3'-5' exonuclease